MKRSLTALSIAVPLMLLVASPALAQQRGGPGQRANRLFDPGTIETVTGVIVGIDSVQSPRGRSIGLHLQLQTEAMTLPVHLGPTWFLADQSFAFQTGDSLAVRGSRVTMDKAPALIAVEVRRGDQSLRLRDESGRPQWRPRRQR
jgi:hypothetical protein